MLHNLTISARANPEVTSSLVDLIQSTSKKLILITGVISLIWQFIPAFNNPVDLMEKTVLPTVVLLLTCILSYCLVSKKLLISQVVWQVGFAVFIVVLLQAYQEPAIGFFLALLPLMSTIMIGWSAGIVSELMILTIVWSLSRSVTALFPSFYCSVILASGILSGVIGWMATQSLLAAMEWSLFSYEQAREKMEEARAQRVEFKQVQEDLIKANNELARLLQRLKALNRVAEEARRAKEEFVANVSHELRTPLNMVVGFSELILNNPKIYGANRSATLMADLHVIYRNATHLLDLINDVLDLSQVEADQMALTKETVSIYEIITAAEEAIRPLYESKGLYVSIEVLENLPMVFCDRTRIRQVMLNLLSNAGRFTERGGVRVKAWQEGENLVVSVADTGPGIPATEMDKLFQPFQQLDNSIHRRYGGTGLGLSITKRFIELHEGKIWIESQEGAGTTFFFQLPLAPLMPIGETYRRGLLPGWEFLQRYRPFKAPVPVVRPRLVILEKGDSLQQLLNRYLDEVDILPIKKMEEAIQVLQDTPALGLLINDPSIGEVLQQLEAVQLPSETPVMICSIPGVFESIAALGVYDYLIKPISRETLLGALEHLQLHSGTVLVVDDQPDAVRLFRRMLTSPGLDFRVLRAKDGREAMNLLSKQRPDLILLDLVMPNLDGYKLIELRNQDAELSKIPLIITSVRDPLSQSVTSHSLAIVRGSGFSLRHLLVYIRMLGEVFSQGAI